MLLEFNDTSSSIQQFPKNKHAFHNKIIKLSSMIIQTIVNYFKSSIVPSEYSSYLLDENSKAKAYTIEDYLSHLCQCFQLDSNMLFLSMMLLDRALAVNPSFVLNESTVHKMIFICIMETLKYQEDNSYSSKDFAKVGFFSTDELLLLEIAFLSSIDYNISFTFQQLVNYQQRLLSLR